MRPEIGKWYRIESGDSAEVVASDGDYVELQHRDGTIEEIEMFDWEEGVEAGVIEAVVDPDPWGDFSEDEDDGEFKDYGSA